MADLNDSFNIKNKKFNIKQLPIAYFNANADKEGSRDQLIKNTIRLNEDNITELSRYFFSDANINLINKQLIMKVYNKSGKKHIISFQSKEDLIVVMRYVWIQHSKNLNFKIKEQIKDLNCLVVGEIYPNIVTNIEQYYKYIEDVNNRENSNFKVNDLPVSSTNIIENRKTSELKPISEVFHKGTKFN